MLFKTGISRMKRVLNGFVERNEMPGLVALVAHRGDAAAEALGSLTFGDSAPMRRDSIFRIASITKPVAAVAAMVLIEECKIRLDDPIDAWLPELADRRVLRTLSSQIDDTVPARRPITLRDLLTSCMGLGSIMAPPDTYPIQKYIRDYHIGGDGPKLPTQFPPMDEWLRNLGSLPLVTQPGERWMYNVSIDVLGALISRVSGQSLGTFMRERIFKPLGMDDTGFCIPAEKLSRLSTFYSMNHATGKLEIFDGVSGTAFGTDPPFESASGGLLSTIDDYYKFCCMMLGKGRYGNARILSRASVELMTSDQVSPAQRSGADLFFGTHSSWGFGLAVDIARHEIYHMPGRFGWTGGFGTTAYVDPENEFIGILFTQRMMDSPEPPKVFTDFWTLAYETMEP